MASTDRDRDNAVARARGRGATTTLPTGAVQLSSVYVSGTQRSTAAASSVARNANCRGTAYHT